MYSTTNCTKCSMEGQRGPLEAYLEEALGGGGYLFDRPYEQGPLYLRRAELAPGLHLVYERAPGIQSGHCPHAADRDLGEYVEDGGMFCEEGSCPVKLEYTETIRLVGERLGYEQIHLVAGHTFTRGRDRQNQPGADRSLMEAEVYGMLAEAERLQELYASPFSYGMLGFRPPDEMDFPGPLEPAAVAPDGLGPTEDYRSRGRKRPQS